ncbi:hypothetical protein FRB90_006571 [Tulasnella sp. 427]|nr:hypothetical protein FRB90_006571 [Tulasnella sp. 427]
MPDPANNGKYPHTSAFIAYLAKEYPGTGQQPSPTEADGDSGGENSSTNQDVVKKVVRLLEEENENGLKQLVKDTFTLDGSDPSLLEQVLLDLMHKHKDDVQGVPFVFLAPMKRPISRPSSRASMHSFRGNRPDTPSSPLARSISLRRPHTPIASPLSAGLHAPPGVIGNGFAGPSPGSSPTINHIAPLTTSSSIPAHLAHGSQPSSPLTSPHFLNAKALEFRPSARPGSAMSGSFGAPGVGRTETPSPDLWAHRPNDIMPNSPRRVSGNLAIASPLGNEGYYPRPSTSLTRSNSGLRKSIPTDLNDNDEEEEIGGRRLFGRIDDEREFSPFSKVTSMNMPRSTAGTHLNQFEDIPPGQYQYSAHLPSSLMQDEPDGYGESTDPFYTGEPYDLNGLAADGMTPFEVLHSVFGSSVPPATLEDALNKNGYDFEAAMVWLIENAHNPSGLAPGSVTQQPPITAAQKLGAASQPVTGSGGRVATASRDILPIMRGAGVTATTQNASSNPQHFGQSRTRFANAVKRQPMVTVTQNAAGAAATPRAQLGVRRVPAGDKSGPATPRPSPRLKLRPPSLLPTLPTGKVVNDLYMSYRAKAIELGGARNVALSRAAEAWKRGDGASAKAFSRQAHELNAKMGKETAEAAEKLVKERARISLEAAMARDTSWSDDPVDRSTRGKAAGGGLGVALGVASDRVGGIGASGGKLTSQERTEVLLDLHGLHSSEGVEVLEEFLLGLEKENFLGLAYIVVGEEKHTGTQDPNRGASRHRLAAGVKQFLHQWQYPWNERDGIVCVDPLTHGS